jgi:HEAT repeat protein
VKKLLLSRILCLIAAGVTMVWISASKLPSEPAFNGQPLGLWLRDLDYSHRPADRLASNAVAQIGTNALPYLGAMLRAQDSKLKLQAIALLRKQSIWKVNFTPAKALRERGSRGCRVLHQNAAQFIPELTLMLDSSDQTTAWCGLVALMDVRPRSEWPLFLDKALTNKSTQVRWASATYLSTLGAASSNSLPKLINCLTDSKAQVRGHAAEALPKIEPDKARLTELVVAQLAGASPTSRVFLMQALEQFAEDSKTIESILTRYLDDPDQRVRFQAEATLKRVKQANAF